METNIQEVVNSLSRQISEMSIKLAIAEATIAGLRPDRSTEDAE
jgi:hypothetical protein